MLPRSVIPVTAVAMFVLSSPAYADGAGPGPTPLILEVALAVAVAIILPFRDRIASGWTSMRRRVTPSRSNRRPVVRRATDA
jgi:hypothetical protein